MIATAAALSDGVRLAVLPVFMSGFGPFLVFLSSFVNKESYWKLGAFDYFNGFLSLLALALWLVTKDPDVAIIVAIASDGFAAVPTLVKLWHFPETELVSPFAAGLFSALTSFAAIDTWHFSSYAFAMYLSLLNISLMSAYFRRRMFS